MWFLEQQFAQTCWKTLKITTNKINYNRSNSSYACPWVRDLVYLSMCLGDRGEILFKCESPRIQQIPHCVWGYLCRRGEGEHQRQQFRLFRSAVHCLLTHSSNWRRSWWQQRSASWQNQTSGGVGHQVGQRDMMSDESRVRATEVRSRTWPAMITNRAVSWMRLHKDKGMDMNWTWGWTGNDRRAGGSEEGWRDKESGMKGIDSLRSRGPQERNHIYEAETAVEIQNSK